MNDYLIHIAVRVPFTAREDREAHIEADELVEDIRKHYYYAQAEVTDVECTGSMEADCREGR